MSVRDANGIDTYDTQHNVFKSKTANELETELDAINDDIEDIQGDIGDLEDAVSDIETELEDCVKVTGTPTDGQVPKWDETEGTYVPADVGGSETDYITITINAIYTGQSEVYPYYYYEIDSLLADRALTTLLMDGGDTIRRVKVVTVHDGSGGFPASTCSLFMNVIWALEDIPTDMQEFTAPIMLYSVDSMGSPRVVEEYIGERLQLMFDFGTAVSIFNYDSVNHVYTTAQIEEPENG